jgi:hypothetical protein
MHPQPYPTRQHPEPALHLLGGIWIASCPTCGYQLTSQDHHPDRHPRAPGGQHQQGHAAGRPLGTEALVYLGATCISGPATALRALADALVEAADLADAYDADPEAFNQREQADRDLDR